MTGELLLPEGGRMGLMRPSQLEDRLGWQWSLELPSVKHMISGVCPVSADPSWVAFFRKEKGVRGRGSWVGLKSRPTRWHVIGWTLASGWPCPATHPHPMGSCPGDPGLACCKAVGDWEGGPFTLI